MKEIFDITVVLNNDQDLKYLMNSNTKIKPYLTIYDERYLDDKKKAYSVKNEYGARETPFVLIFKDGKYLNAIWKESTEDPIKELISFLNQENK
jgi:hypothetical protein